MDATGERYLPTITSPFISYEHWHRYLFATPFVRDKDVLDIASGEGYGSHFLSSLARSVIGIDIDPEAVSHAQQTYHSPNLSYLVGSAADIPLEDQHLFDVIVSFETLEHLDSASQSQFMQHATRLLRPGGVLLISTPNRVLYNAHNQDANPFHLHEFDKDEFLAFLGRWFPHVRIFAQRVYPSSLIWMPNSHSTSLSLAHIGKLDGRFSPVPHSFLQELYLIAVCSDREITAESGSVMVDTSDSGFQVEGHADADSTAATLYYDTGCGFNENHVLRVPLDLSSSAQCLRYTIPADTMRLRWDPIEGRIAAVHALRFTWTLIDGRTIDTDSTQLRTNGAWASSYELRFATLDPMIWLDSLPTDACELTIHCDIHHLPRTESLSHLNQLASSALTEMPSLQREVQRLSDSVHRLSDEARRLRANSAALITSSLYLDTGDGYSESCRLVDTIDESSVHFRFHFDTTDYQSIQSVRWDPVEQRTCWVSLVKAVAHGIDVDCHTYTTQLDPEMTNGVHDDSGGVRFDTLDPMIVFRVPPSVREVVLEGRWIIDSLQTTLERCMTMMNHAASSQITPSEVVDLSRSTL